MFVRLRALSAIFVVTALFAALLSGVTSPARAVGEDSGGVFVPVTPFRLVDTAAADSSPHPANWTRSYKVLGYGGVPTTGVSAVVVDIAVKSATATGSSYLKVWPSGEPMPGPATMFYTAANAPRSNTAIVKVGTDSKISIYNYAGTTDIDLDIQGYFTTASDANSTGGFVPVTPTRVANSITGDGVPQAQLAVGSSIDVQVSNGEEIPADATAVFANIEVQSDSTSGNLRIGKGGQSAANVPPTVNYQDNGPTSSGVTLPLSTDGKIRILNSFGGNVNFKVDIQGYFSGHAEEGGSYTALTPAGIYSSTSTGNTPLAGGETRTLQVTGLAGIPDDGTAGSAVVSVTAVNWSANGTLTVYDADDEGPPETTNLNFKTGEGATASTTTAIVELSTDGEISIRNTSTASVGFYLSAQGWFTSGFPTETPCSLWLAANGTPGPSGTTTTATCEGDLVVEQDTTPTGAISYRVTNITTGEVFTGSDLETLDAAVEVPSPADPPPETVEPQSVTTAAADDHPARSKSTTKYFAKWEGSELVTKGWVRVTVRVTLGYNHSANVRVTTASNRNIYSSYKLRIRHHKGAAKDHTEFTFPSVYSCPVSTACVKQEYWNGDGWDELPWEETGAKYFYDVYRQTIRYNGDDYPTVGSYQSQHVTCYKTVECKWT